MTNEQYREMREDVIDWLDDVYHKLVRRPIRELITFPWQRVRRGYDDKQLWDLRSHLAQHIHESVSSFYFKYHMADRWGVGWTQKQQEDTDPNSNWNIAKDRADRIDALAHAWGRVVAFEKHGDQIYPIHAYKEKDEDEKKALKEACDLLAENLFLLWD
jgi:hypothetical protein